MEIVRWEWTPVEELGEAVKRQVVWGTKANLTRFALASGAHVLAHRHEAEQFTSVVDGALKLQVGDEAYVLHAGDMLVIPSDTEHEAWALEDTVVVDFFAPAREDWREGKHHYLTGDG